MNKNMWSPVRFAEMFKNGSPKTAFLYREACLGYAVPKEYLDESDIKKEIKPIKNEEKEVKKDTPEINRDELISKLNGSEIKFFKGAKTEVLLKLCIENKLV